MLRIIRFIFGYVVFSATGPFPERFLNLSARYGISLWNIKRKGEKFCASALISEYPSLKKIAEKSSMQIQIQQKKGLILFVKKYRKRKGILLGTVCFWGIIYCLSLYTWNIEIKGNENIAEPEIKSLLTELNVESGTQKRKIDVGLIESTAMNRFINISWISANMIGSNLEIEIKEKVVPPTLVPNDQPCNIKAATDGFITRTEVYSGTAEIKVGDAVLKDQLLVNGVVEDSFGKSTICHAEAKIFATTTKTFKESIDLNIIEEVPTGKVVVRKHLNFLGVKIPLTLNCTPCGEYKREVDINNIKICNSPLPISIYKENWTQFKKEKKVLDQTTANIIAKENLERRENLELKGIKIQKRDITEKVIDNKYFLISKYTCEENIAIKEPISVN